MTIKRATIVVDVGSIHEFALTDKEIKEYIQAEMECIYNVFKVISVKTEEVPNDTNETV